MMRFKCFSLFVLVLTAQGLCATSNEKILFDFETPSQLRRLTCNTPVKISDQWASKGKYSLKINFTKYDSKKNNKFPGVSCWTNKIPQRDWRNFKYYSFDLHVPKQDTYLGVIVQRSSNRRDRIDRRYVFPAGTYRLWFNLKELVASGGDLETLKQIHEIEFFESYPLRPAVVFIDNIRLCKRFSPVSLQDNKKGLRDILIQTVNKTKAGFRNELKDFKRDLIEPLALAKKDKIKEQIEILDKLKSTTELRMGELKLQTLIEEEFHKNGYGALVAPVESQVFFDCRDFSPSWERKVQLDLLKGEIRSKQIVIFPKLGTRLEKIKIIKSNLKNTNGKNTLSKDNLEFELVGYVKLPVTAQNQFAGTRFGWYPDPIVRLTKPFDIIPPRLLQPVLLTVKAPRDIPTGKYSGVFTIKPQNKPAFDLDISINIRKQKMPVTPKLPNLWHCGIEEFFPDFRMNPNNAELGSIYRWGTRVNIDKISKLVNKGMNCFNLMRISRGNLGSRCSKLGEQKGIKSFVDYIHGLYPDSVMEDMQAKGISSKAVFYGFDEIDHHNPIWRKRIEGVFGQLKKIYGKYGVKTSMTPHEPMTLEDFDLPVDIWIPTIRTYDPSLASIGRQHGREIWCYFVSWELYNQPGWIKTLLWSTFANEVDGLLYYHTIDWCDGTQKLDDDKALTKWIPESEKGIFGTGAIVYKDKDSAPRPSLRLVNYREGMFDYDLLCLLNGKVQKLSIIKNLSDSQRLVLERANAILKNREGVSLNRFLLHPEADKKLNNEIMIDTDHARNLILELLDELDHISESLTKNKQSKGY